jgi:hypothetical protein
MTVEMNGKLEIDAERGVIYFHATDPKVVEKLGFVTVLRICRLPTPIPTDKFLDITHMHGTDWG